MNLYVYDIETYPNCFTLAAQRLSDGARWFYEVSDRKYMLNELRAFLDAIKFEGAKMIGFNNEMFDYYVIHYIMTGAATNSYQLYDLAMQVIKHEGDYPPRIWPSDVLIPQIDLFKIHHFDNKARSTSLKVLEFNMNSLTVEDLPFEPGALLEWEQMDVLRTYNIHDVSETVKFAELSMEKIKFREELTEKYGLDFTNFNDTKIGKQTFILKLEEEHPGSCYHSDKSPRQTPRHQIKFTDVILPQVKFYRDEFRAIHKWLLDQTITVTKGVFNDIEECDAYDVFPYAKYRKRRRPYIPGEVLKPFQWIESSADGKKYYVAYNQMDALNVNVNGLNVVFGVGGVHASVESQIVHSDSYHMIVDLDVASYYPNLAITNGFRPEHLGEEFCTIYRDVYEQRKLHKKGTSINAALKLALNGVYGDSNNKYSPFYDPQYTMQITVNGQLLMCMLAERLMRIRGLEIIQINTDGLTVKLPRQYYPDLEIECEFWQQETGLTLEEARYKRMFIRDVNNYIGEYEDGKLKRKGAYEYELEWHQNHSEKIVAKAAEAHLVRGEPIRDFISKSSNIFDFCICTKVNRSSRLILTDGDTEFPMQNTLRYYITDRKHGGSLVKIMPPLPGSTEERRMGQCVGWYVNPCNDIMEATAPINVDYYVEKAEKLCAPLKGE